MIYLNTPYTQVHSQKLKKYLSSEEVNTGSEVVSEGEFIEAAWWKEKRNRRDRRQRSIKPLLDLRVTRDRRVDPDRPPISIKV